MTTITLIDDNIIGETIIVGETKAEALEKLYYELAGRNDGDCAKWIEAGSVPSTSCGHTQSFDIDLGTDPVAFWSALVNIMLADSQDYNLD